jgi:LacI family transcriptional regulator
VYLGTILDPPLTTVSSPIERMGRDACKLLLDRIEKKLPDEGPIHIQLEPMLTIRNSTNRR